MMMRMDMTNAAKLVAKYGTRGVRDMAALWRATANDRTSRPLPLRYGVAAQLVAAGAV